MYDAAGKIMAYEQGELGTRDTVTLFSHLVKSGLAWKLQGSYGRAAEALIERGILDRSGTINEDLLDELVN